LSRPNHCRREERSHGERAHPDLRSGLEDVGLDGGDRQGRWIRSGRGRPSRRRCGRRRPRWVGRRLRRRRAHPGSCDGRRSGRGRRLAGRPARTFTPSVRQRQAGRRRARTRYPAPSRAMSSFCGTTPARTPPVASRRSPVCSCGGVRHATGRINAGPCRNGSGSWSKQILTARTRRGSPGRRPGQLVRHNCEGRAQPAVSRADTHRLTSLRGSPPALP